MPSSASPPPETYTLSLHDALPISLASEGATLDRLFIQVGGAALASAVIASFVEAQRLGAIERLPRFHTVQTRGGFPLQRAYELLVRSEEHTSELQSQSNLVCRLLLHRHPRPTLFPYTTLFRSRSPRRARRSTVCSSRSVARRWPRPSSHRSLKRSGWARSKGSRGSIPCRRGEDFPCSGRTNSWSDRKSTRLNSSHSQISYAVFCFTATRDLHSFPTRRSSDLARLGGRDARPSVHPGRWRGVGLGRHRIVR